MQWFSTAHVRPYHAHYHSSGHVWRGRFKAFPIQADEHFLTVLRYVERNALRAGLVEKAEDWRWTSLALRSLKPVPKILSPSPVTLRSVARHNSGAADSIARIRISSTVC